jgi:hypothetical protein
VPYEFQRGGNQMMRIRRSGQGERTREPSLTSNGLRLSRGSNPG